MEKTNLLKETLVSPSLPTDVPILAPLPASGSVPMKPTSAPMPALVHACASAAPLAAPAAVATAQPVVPVLVTAPRSAATGPVPSTAILLYMTELLKHNAILTTTCVKLASNQEALQATVTNLSGAVQPLSEGVRGLIESNTVAQSRLLLFETSISDVAATSRQLTDWVTSSHSYVDRTAPPRVSESFVSHEKLHGQQSKMAKTPKSDDRKQVSRHCELTSESALLLSMKADATYMAKSDADQVVDLPTASSSLSRMHKSSPSPPAKRRKLEKLKGGSAASSIHIQKKQVEQQRTGEKRRHAHEFDDRSEARHVVEKARHTQKRNHKNAKKSHEEEDEDDIDEEEEEATSRKPNLHRKPSSDAEHEKQHARRPAKKTRVFDRPPSCKVTLARDRIFRTSPNLKKHVTEELSSASDDSEDDAPWKADDREDGDTKSINQS
jgi:hypothetical protein